MSNKRIAIIGGGAAGLAAAVACPKDAKVKIFEKNDRVGKKLLRTGNGRCNILNTNCAKEFYASDDMDMVKRVISRYTPDKLMKFFEDLGLFLRTDSEGRVYPMCNQASAVLDILRYSAQENGVGIECAKECIGAEKAGEDFMLRFADGKREYADCVILACGGMAAPETGSDGTGYKIAKMLGHSLIKPAPSLVALKSEQSFTKALKGIRCKADIALLKNGDEITRQSGEIQFTDYGISGIAAMQLSRFVDDSDDFEIMIDFAPEYDADFIMSQLMRSKDKGRSVQNLMLGIVQKRVGEQIVKKSLKVNLLAGSDILNSEDIKKLSESVKGLKLKIFGTLSWENAQVTRGGIPLCEVQDDFESKICKGLYITGEMLDCDGACGGYNLGWAWSSGIAAALAAGGTSGR